MSEKSPSFEDGLKDFSAPTVKLPGILLKRMIHYEIPADPHIKKTLKISVLVHCFLFGAVFLINVVPGWLGFQIPWLKPVEMKPSRTAIRVDIVDLPSMKVSELHKIDALEKIASQEATPESDTSMKLPSDPAEAAKKKAELEKLKKADSEKSAKQRLKELQQNLRDEARRKEAMDKLKDDIAKQGQGGRPLLAGNQISAGYATQGELATATDEYNGKLRQHLRQFWQVPGWMTVSKLRARVLVKIAPDGRVLEKKFLEKSGNVEFDESVEQALVGASPFPAPEAGLAKVYMEEGVEWGFPE